jgi:hypothetical protein
MTLTELKQKLLQGTPLSDAKHDAYGKVSSSLLDKKQTYIKDKMQHQVVDEGVITS